jgi:hypothetical protein
MILFSLLDSPPPSLDSSVQISVWVVFLVVLLLLLLLLILMMMMMMTMTMMVMSTMMNLATLALHLPAVDCGPVALWVRVEKRRW